jgi:hypothetical protein
VAKIKRNMQKCRLYDRKTGKYTPLIVKKHFRYLSGKLHNAVALEGNMRYVEFWLQIAYTKVYG